MSASHRIQALASAAAVLFTCFPRTASADCRLEGSFAKALTVYSAKTGEGAVARLSGNSIFGTVDHLPEASQGRARLVTRGFRIEGFVDAKSLPLRLEREVSVVPERIFVRRGAAVELVGLQKNVLRVRPAGPVPLEPIPATTVACDALSIGQESLAPPPAAGNARGYVLDIPATSLFWGANSEASTLRAQRLEREPLLFWSLEQTDTRVHVRYEGRVRIDAWVNLREVRALPPGETIDQLGSGSAYESTGPSALGESAKPLVAPARAAIRIRANDEAPIVGVVEPGTDLYLLSVMRGWASVVPKSLAVLPSGTSRFWVKADKLGL